MPINRVVVLVAGVVITMTAPVGMPVSLRTRSCSLAIVVLLHSKLTWAHALKQKRAFQPCSESIHAESCGTSTACNWRYQRYQETKI